MLEIHLIMNKEPNKWQYEAKERKRNYMNKFGPGYCATKRRKAAGRMMGSGGGEERRKCCCEEEDAGTKGGEEAAVASQPQSESLRDCVLHSQPTSWFGKTTRALRPAAEEELGAGLNCD